MDLRNFEGIAKEEHADGGGYKERMKQVDREGEKR
jgi:hypothetical protein